MVKLLNSLIIVVLFTTISPIVDNTIIWEHDIFGGHSRDFRSIFEPINWEDRATQGRQRRFERSLISSDEETTDYEIADFITSHRPAAIALINNIKTILEHKWASVSVRIKSFQSLKNKLSFKNYTLSKIKDVIGIRLTAQTVSEARELLQFLNITRNKTFTINFVKCYGICDNFAECKGICNLNEVPYAESGYRRIHLLVKIHGYDKWAEIQLGTPYTNMWSDWSHDLLYKGEFSKITNEDAEKYAKNVSEYLLQLDLQRDSMVDCPNILKESLTENIFNPEVRGELIFPQNLCFHWGDVYFKITIPDNLNPSSGSRLRVSFRLMFITYSLISLLY